ncbi:MAG: hypothetical protein JSS06_04605 [Proteobacteria bacterium]|nr:hypothetical protein [Pseudomonadota bacterium]
MLKVKISIIMIILFFVTLSFTGCSDKLPIGLAHDLERASDTKFGFVALIDSNTGQAKYLKNINGVAASTFFDEPQSASEIKEVTTISVIGVSGIAGYQSCNHVTVDSRHVEESKFMEDRLICRDNESREITRLQDSDNFSEIPTLPRDLLDRLASAGGINNLGFLILTDVITGKTKLFKHENYVDRDFRFPLSVTEVKNNNSWSVVTFKVNPCSQCTVNSDGQRHCTYLVYCPK